MNAPALFTIDPATPKLTSSQARDELVNRHPRLIASRRAGHQCPDRSMEALVDLLHQVPDDLLSDPVAAAQLLPQLIPHTTRAALRAYCWAYVGGAAAALFRPSRVWYGNPAEEWQARGALLLAGMAAVPRRFPR